MFFSMIYLRGILIRTDDQAVFPVGAEFTCLADSPFENITKQVERKISVTLFARNNFIWAQIWNHFQFGPQMTVVRSSM